MAKPAKTASAPSGKKRGRPPGSGKKTTEPKVAKAQAKAAAADAATAPVVAREVPSENQIKNLLKSTRGLKKDIGELTGTLREKIGYAVENQHLHAKAFALTRQCDNMEPEKLAAFLDHFDHYMEVSGLNKRAASASGNLPLGEPEAAGPAGASLVGEIDIDAADEMMAVNTDPGLETDAKVSRPQFGRTVDAPAA